MNFSTSSQTSRSFCWFVTFVFLWLLDLSNQTAIGGQQSGDVVDLDRLVLPPVESLDCIHFQTVEGLLTTGIEGTSDTTCGLYLIGELNTRVTVDFMQFDARCNEGSLVAILDGWEQAGSTFPAASDLSPEDAKNQYHTYCGESRPLASFVSSGNFALIQYKLAPGDRFTVRITFQRNFQPCNQVAQGDEGVFELRNFRQRANCSVMIIHPQTITLPFMSIGTNRRGKMSRRQTLESRLPRPKKLSVLQRFLQSLENTQCPIGDYAEVLGGATWSLHNMQPYEQRFCGPRRPIESVQVACETTIVRLVSSGKYDNIVVVKHGKLDRSIPGSGSRQQTCMARTLRTSNYR